MENYFLKLNVNSHHSFYSFQQRLTIMKVTEVTRPFPMQFGVLQDINVKIDLENN